MRALSLIASFYNRAQFIAEPETFFPAAEAIEPRLSKVRKLRDGEVVDLTWPSAFEPMWSREALRSHFGALSASQLEQAGLSAETVDQLGFDQKRELGDKYFSARANRHGHARWFRHASGPRPTVLLLHGYIGGSYAIEERLWPVERLYASGMDVLLTVLPFHGPRRAEARGMLPPAFPSSDPRFTIEGFRQLVFDHRALFDYLARSGVSKLGLMGMSLGGYASSLLATLDPRVGFVVPFIPLAAIEDFAHSHGRFTGALDEQEAQREGMRLAHWAVSPFARTPHARGERAIVIVGDADLITGRDHGQRLAAHFESELQSFLGGHLLHFGRGRAFETVWRMLANEGFSARG